ncbi:glycosyltransferase family A protein [Agrobacterium larrymoorei]|uniref:Glycosyltransferase involved in cell wall biosynthesis n=1 Tax=Agrobacterium larrymoorei TaxID=160699 RepID=A0ABU0UJT2_9HYPH|nr:glycosyltransferase family A protein [Agrobacterium larrymoorei]MDQ1185206.1 glycosyltransferase involved in cell wall biosynthesis [Agrobacterium larrymoorei]
MLTVIMECHNNEPALAHTLSALVTGAVKGLISDVIILDHASQDGSARVAEAAGCRFHQSWKIDDVIQSIRGDWILLIEPGSRPQGGWIEDILEYMALNERPAQFSPSRYYKKPFLERMLRRGPPLEFGLLLRKRDAIELAKSGLPLKEFSKTQKPLRLTAELVPAWALSPVR